MATIEPLDTESALAFVVRADILKVSDQVINRVLKDHFGYEDKGSIKELRLGSKPFWVQLYRKRIEELFKGGCGRYSAEKVI
ncbi:MAG: hypothetical protein AAFQ04_10645 [Pseudomonadota bacterium]